jgi:hypothetical protein
MATHVEFLWQQIQTAITDSKTSRKFFSQPIWGEISPLDLTAISPAHDPKRARPRCVVTPYVDDLFNWIFADGLEIVGPDTVVDDGVLSNHDVDPENLEIPNVLVPGPQEQYAFHHGEYRSAVYPRFTTRTTGSIKVGDVIELPRDEMTRWKESTQRWYAFVTNRWKTAKGAWKLSILWLYWPEDVALCKSMKYPHSNEVGLP